MLLTVLDLVQNIEEHINFYTLSLIVVQSLINIFSNMELDCCVHVCVYSVGGVPLFALCRKKATCLPSVYNCTLKYIYALKRNRLERPLSKINAPGSKTIR